MSRRTARGQQLPPQEVELLNLLDLDHLIVRVHALYHAGWPLQSIGDSLVPSRQRSTIRSWVLRVDEQASKHEVNVELPVPPKLETPPIPLPIDKSATPKSDNLAIPDDLQAQIKQLAPIARTYRSRMSSTSAAAVANSRLKDICRRLYESGASVKDLADSAGVTYRAMYKRLFL